MKKIAKTLINLVLICVLIYSGYNIYLKVSEYKEADVTYEEIRDIKEESTNLKEDLSNINEDFRYWVMVDGTNIDYPVVQSTDNYYYLYKDFYGNKLSSGTIFMDYRNNWAKGSDKNTILYGHNMRNKTMFENIELYKEEDFFYGDNKIRIIEDDKEYIYEVFSAYVTEPAFNYIETDFNSEAEYESFLDTIIDKSLYKPDIDIDKNDQIITLSTCSYEFEEARTVVHGRLVK